MTDQDVLSEIRALKSDLSLISDQMVRLRYGDLKSVFLEQMRMAMGDKGRRSFLDDAAILSNSSGCDLKGVCLQKMEEAVDMAISSFMKDDLTGAKNILEMGVVMVKGDTSSCQDGRCSKTAEETLSRLLVLLQIYEDLAGRLGPEIEQRMGPTRDVRQYNAEEMQSVLDPLANAWRIKVLASLRRRDHSLTELGRSLDLKTGHLQFTCGHW